LVVEDARGGNLDEAAMFSPAQSRPRAARLYAADRAPPPRQAGRWRFPISPRGCAPCRQCRLPRPTTRCSAPSWSKLFADRQLDVDDALIGYLMNPDRALMRRARAAVAELDHAALRLKRPVNRAACRRNPAPARPLTLNRPQTLMS